MSVSVSGGGNVAGVATVATGAVVLPFTHGNVLVSYVILTAMVCGMVVILSKVAKRIITRFYA